MDVYLVYNGDQWLSTSSLYLVAVCTSREKAEELLLEDMMKNYGIVSCESVPEDEYNEANMYLEDCIRELENHNCVMGPEWAYTIDTVKADEII